MRFRTDLRVRHRREGDGPSTDAELVTRAEVRPAQRRPGQVEVLVVGVAEPDPLPSELLGAFVEGIEAAVADQPALHGHDVVVTVTRVRWDLVHATPRSFHGAGEVMVRRLVSALSGDDGQTCPVCGKAIPRYAPHPDRLCPECVSRAVDGQGRLLRLYNESLGGGFMAVHADDGRRAVAVERDHIVYVDGVRCRADEARLGGIVVSADTSA